LDVIRALLRLFSYLFHGLLGLFLICVSGLALASGVQDLRIDFLPWSGRTLIYVLLFAGVLGLVCLLLAIRGTLRVLFFFWTMAVVAFLLRGYFLSQYRFLPGEAIRALYLTLASLIAAIGAWPARPRRADTMPRWDRY